MQVIEVQFCWLDPCGCQDLALPAYKTSQASGMDAVATITEDTVLQPGEIKLLSTGFAVALPNGYEIQVRPRSGLALKYGVTVVNVPGAIYRCRLSGGGQNRPDQSWPLPLYCSTG